MRRRRSTLNDKKLKHVFATSNIRDAIVCDECGRSWLIFSMLKPSKKEYELLASYKETVDYTCGSALFSDTDDLPKELKPLRPRFSM